MNRPFCCRILQSNGIPAWRLQCLRVVICLAIPFCAGGGVSLAQPTPLTVTVQPTEPTPLQDDATLHDVAIVGENGLWAVGEHGAIWKSDDAGANWKFLSLGETFDRYAFHSVCFLTDRVGWVAGGTVLHAGSLPVGIVLATKDGGSTWTIERATQLPYVRHVRFFDLENGIAAGDRSIAFPSGVFQTSDGGQNWIPVEAKNSGRWNAAAFTNSRTGILAGDQGTQAVVTNGSVVSTGTGLKGLRGFHGASLDAAGRGWLTGDGSLLYRTENAGGAWAPIHPQLPEELGDFTNFQSITHQGDQAWIAGSPGSVIWHSSDAGNTWEAQPTGEPVPLRAIRFIDPQRGIAAGQLGRIILTNDGGKTWKPVRGAGRRLACLAVQTSLDRAAVPFLMRWSREEGYRSAVLISTRRDTGDDAHVAEQADLRLSHAVQTSGAAAGWIDWRLPIGIPGLEKDREKLIREWSLRTDRRLTEVLLESLVAEIRIWRPSVLLIDEPETGEFATELIQLAVTKAMQQAADPNVSVDQHQLAGLAPWSVKKLVVQKLPGNRGTISQDPQEILPYQGKTLELAVVNAFSQLSRNPKISLERMDCVVARMQGDSPLSDRNVFGDLAIAPGSEARRALQTITSTDYDKLITEANHRRMIAAITERAAANPAQAGQLLGQLKEIIAPLSPAQAAQQLASLGQMYHRQGEWGLAESVYAELLSRYPDQPVSVDAMFWLMQYWTSAEMNWQRLRTMQATGSMTRTGAGMDPMAAQSKLEQAIQTARAQQTKTAAALNTPELGFPGSTETQSLVLANGNMQSYLANDGTSGSQADMQLRRWQNLAIAVAGAMRDSYPHLFEQPEMQFLMAALYRRRSDHKKSDEIYSNFMKTLSDDPWNVAARGEAYLLRPGVQSPKPVIVCKTTRTPPILDGILSDPCWKDAYEIRLGEQSDAQVFVGTTAASTSTPSRAGAQPVIMVCHDDHYFYLAGTIPVHAELPNDPPERAGRTHDADLELFDRICLQLDVDRDYGTYYQFEIDQRGQTRDSCWDNVGYNPKWHCATTRENDAWRLECAIPLEELLPSGPLLIGTSWGVGIGRILPGVGSQSWTSSGAASPRPALFGLMRFE